ncbi:hypothetical protein ACIQ9M_29530 [Streptomyces californicus]|uniref:hypothetical protein n=1 Tax=Streptomyces californicus TaxID=67351 RepID=UPI0036A22C78
MSDQAHSSIGDALRIIGVEPFAVPTMGHRITGPVLRTALLADAGPSHATGVAAAGTANAGIIDELAGVAAVVRDFDGLLAPSVRDRYAGIEQDDPRHRPPRKWLIAPFARRRVRRRHAAAGIRPGPACGQ